MRNRMLAELYLFCFALNFTGMLLMLMTGHLVAFILEAVFCAICHNWLVINYFDPQEK